MRLAAEKLREFAKEASWVARNGVRVVVVGELDALPEDVRRAADEVMEATRHYSR